MVGDDDDDDDDDDGDDDDDDDVVGGRSGIIRPDYAIHCFSHTNCDDQDDYDGGEEDYDDGDFKSCTSQNLTEIFKSSGGKK